MLNIIKLNYVLIIFVGHQKQDLIIEIEVRAGNYISQARYTLELLPGTQGDQ